MVANVSNVRSECGSYSKGFGKDLKHSEYNAPYKVNALRLQRRRAFPRVTRSIIRYGLSASRKMQAAVSGIAAHARNYSARITR